jgi:hypothetical protein
MDPTQRSPIFTGGSSVRLVGELPTPCAAVETCGDISGVSRINPTRLDVKKKIRIVKKNSNAEKIYVWCL